MGLDLGFEEHGFEVKVALDNDNAVEDTIRANGRAFPVVTNNVSNVTASYLLKQAGLRIGEATVVTGAPPCEPFSTAGARNGFRDHRADAVHSFIEIVRDIRPEYFAFEEVPGFLRAAKRHISFYERARMKDHEIDDDAKLGSAFDEVMEDFEGLGYHLSFDPDEAQVVASQLCGLRGPAETRPVRLDWDTSRSGDHVTKTDSRCSGLGGRASWQQGTVGHTPRRAGRVGPRQMVNISTFPRSGANIFIGFHPGGCWRDLSEDLHRIVLGGAYDDGTDPRTRGMKGGRTGFLRRLSWDRPSPTLVDRPTNKANCLCHPDKHRPLSVKEYARIQGFADELDVLRDAFSTVPLNRPSHTDPSGSCDRCQDT